jgi:hypothetical protein
MRHKNIVGDISYLLTRIRLVGLVKETEKLNRRIAATRRIMEKVI